MGDDEDETKTKVSPRYSARSPTGLQTSYSARGGGPHPREEEEEDGQQSPRSRILRGIEPDRTSYLVFCERWGAPPAGGGGGRPAEPPTSYSARDRARQDFRPRILRKVRAPTRGRRRRTASRAPDLVFCEG